MSANQAFFAIATMARVLSVSTAGYYAWRSRRPQGARQRIAGACRSELAQDDGRHDRTNLD